MSEDYYKINNGYHDDKDRYVIEIENNIDNNKTKTIAYFTENSYRDFAENMIQLISTTNNKKKKKEEGE